MDQNLAYTYGYKLNGLQRGEMKLLFFVLLMLFANGYAGARQVTPPFPRTITTWVQQRVGPVVYANEGSGHTWQEYHTYARALGARAVKTWVAGTKVGEIPATINTDPRFADLVRRFNVVHINLCPGHIMAGYKNGTPYGTISAAALADVRTDWRDTTRWLLEHRRDTKQVFLLSVGSELNCWFGTKGHLPDFPVATYVNACHQGMMDAIRAWGNKPRPYVYSVAEIQSDLEFAAFTRKWAPQFHTDLVALSFYQYRGPEDRLAFLHRYVPARGPFGRQRLMLGEFGPSLEGCDGDANAQANWHRDILEAAWKEGVQFAFFYEIADNDSVIAVGSHVGLVRLVDHTPSYRPVWHLYHDIYTKGVWNRYERPSYEELSAPLAPHGDADLVVESITVSPARPHVGDKVTISCTIRNQGTEPVAKGIGVFFFVDNRCIAWSNACALEPGATSAAVLSTKCNPEFTWVANSPGQHHAKVLVNTRYDKPESDFSNDHKEITFNCDLIR